MKLKKFLGAAVAVALLAGGAAIAVPLSASAHTPEISSTCTTISAHLTNYEYVPGKPAEYGTRVVTPAIPEVPAVEGTPDVTVVEYEYSDGTWHEAGWKSPSEDIAPTGQERVTVVEEGTPGTPAVPAVPAVTEQYETKAAVPAQDNTITLKLDGAVTDVIHFGVNYDGTKTIDGTKDHKYEISIDAIGTAYDKKFTGKTTACAKVPLVAPTVTPTPPTCDAAGTIGFSLSNPTGADNGYNDFAAGVRRFVQPALNGPGTYVVTTQGVGAGAVGYEATFPYGTKVTETKQTVTVLPAIGYHNTANGARNCYVAPQEPKVTSTEWTDGEYACDATSVEQTRTVSTTPYIFDTKTGTYSEGVTTTAEETRTRDLADSEIKDCPVVVVPPTEEPTPTATPTPTETAAPVAAKVTDESLAFTGANAAPYVFGGAFLLLVGGALLFMRRRKAGQN